MDEVRPEGYWVNRWEEQSWTGARARRKFCKTTEKQVFLSRVCLQYSFIWNSNFLPKNKHTSLRCSTVLLPSNPFRATHCCWSSPDSGHGLEGKKSILVRSNSLPSEGCVTKHICRMRGGVQWGLPFVCCPARKQAVTCYCTVSILFLWKCSGLASSARRGAKRFPALLN